MGLDLGDIQRNKNTSEMIATALRSAILRGKLQSGQALRQDEIAAQFNVSKIPVREALVQLQAEGLVKLNPSRGAVVSSLSLEEVDEIYTIRLALEPMALRRAFPNFTPRDFMQGEHILNKIDHETDLTRWAELNWEFHEALYRPAKMPHLLRTIHDLHNNVVRFLVHTIDRSQLDISQRQHRELLALCRAGDIEGACVLLQEHLCSPVTMFANRSQTPNP
ncbi:MAG: GntR family transcriptional regulator [bacterium]|nr:GntR family transcriptional regulator [bacterium]